MKIWRKRRSQVGREPTLFLSGGYAETLTHHWGIHPFLPQILVTVSEIVWFITFWHLPLVSNEKNKNTMPFSFHTIFKNCTNISTDVWMRTKFNTTCYYRVTCDSNTFTNSIILLSDENRSDKQLICRQAHTTLQYIYKYKIPLRRGSEWLNLLHRQARNHFANKLRDIMFKTSLPRIKISVASINEIVTRPYKKNLHIFIRSFQESESFHLMQHYHEQNNDCVHNYQIYNRRVTNCRTKIYDAIPTRDRQQRNLFLELLV